MENMHFRWIGACSYFLYQYINTCIFVLKHHGNSTFTKNNYLPVTGYDETAGKQFIGRLTILHRQKRTKPYRKTGLRDRVL